MGIDAIEIAAINQGNDYFDRFDYIDVDTHNESVYNKVRNSFAKRVGYVLVQCRRVCAEVQSTLQKGQFPIVLSGDHSSALGSISGVKAAFPDRRLGVIWIDAHADLHSPFTSPSGNVHGMPLAAATGEDNKDFKINQVTGDTDKHWSAMKNIGISGAKVHPSEIVYFGVRDAEEPEEKQIEKLNIRNYMVHEIRHRGVITCVNEALSGLKKCDMIYITFDVDSLDCDMISKGTGTPVDKGFDQYEVIEIIKNVIACKKVVCFEICEVNPLLDFKGNKMAETAFQVLDEVTELIIKHH